MQLDWLQPWATLLMCKGQRQQQMPLRTVLLQRREAGWMQRQLE
jgi:hypothetical protein